MSFNALFNTQPTNGGSSSPTRIAAATHTPQKNKARYLEARANRRTPRGKERSQTLPPEKMPKLTASAAPAAAVSLPSTPTTPARTPSPRKAQRSPSSPPERWANGLVSPPPSALPIPCFDDDDVGFSGLDVGRVVASSAQRQLVFA